MGKRQVHVVMVRKPVTLALLALISAGMIALLWYLSGKAYAAEVHPAGELLARLAGSGRGALSRDAALAFLMPVLGNALFFVPWGFLAFVALDSDRWPRRRTYILTVIAAAAFALTMFLWQESLPTRVTSLPDTVANSAGALAGAALGHARKSVRVRFDF